MPLPRPLADAAEEGGRGQEGLLIDHARTQYSHQIQWQKSLDRNLGCPNSRV